MTKGIRARRAGAAAFFLLLCVCDHLSPPAVPFTVCVSADQSVLIHDTLKIRLSVHEPGVWGLRYVWFVDSSYKADTTMDSVLSLVFSVSDTGVRRVVVRALDGNGRTSPELELPVMVGYRRPSVALAADTVSFSGAPYLLRMSGTGGGSGVDHFTWYIDDPLAAASTFDTIHSWIWGMEDTGVHTIGARAVDRDGIASLQVLLGVRVLSGAPLIEPLRDTMLSSGDTLTITCSAYDPNGAVAAYLWALSGPGWDDSTALPSHLLWYGGSGVVPVRVGVRDNDGLVSTAAFTVTFNRPPETLAVSTPLPDDTIVVPENEAFAAAAFTYGAVDPDNDSIVYALQWRAESGAVDSLVYQGSGRAFLLEGIAPGRYLWRLDARDIMGHTVERSGTIVVLREHRICFVGHSIVLGVGGSDTGGGFRAGVLDSLRAILGPYERLRALGPLTSNGYMVDDPADDSCMAVSGIPADILFNMVSVCPTLTADIWVMMSGVNDDYNPKGLRYTVLLMDLLYGRNPDSRIYVLNGIPVHPSLFAPCYWLPSFNQYLSDSIAVRAAYGADVFEVDAFSSICDSSGGYDSTLYVDYLHPNPAGYGRLRDAVYAAMKSSDPPVLGRP